MKKCKRDIKQRHLQRKHARKSCWSAPVFYRQWIRMESMHLAKAIERIDSLWILRRDLGTIATV